MNLNLPNESNCFPWYPQVILFLILHVSLIKMFPLCVQTFEKQLILFLLFISTNLSGIKFPKY